MIKVENLEITIHKYPLLKGINFAVKTGEIVRFVGPNGVGKSTLLEIILGHRTSKTGKVNYTKWPLSFGYLPQVSHQFPKIYLQLKDICPTPFTFYPASLLEKNWHTASGGERKKSLIARTLKDAKDLIVLDEPFNHLDELSVGQVSEELIRLAKSGVAIIYTGHDFQIPGSRDIEVIQWRC